MRAPHRTKFDPTQDFVARKRLTVSGVTYDAAADFDKTTVSPRKLALMFAQRSIVYKDLPNAGERLTADQAAQTFRGKRAALAARPRRRPKAKPDPKTETVTDPAAIAAARAAVVIPKDWATLPWPQRLKLAAQFADAPVKNGEQAAAAIEAELARRGNP